MSIEDIKKEIEECDSKIKEINEKRKELHNKLYEMQSHDAMEFLIGKYIKVNMFGGEKDYRIFKIEKVVDVVDSTTAYFKVSHFLRVYDGNVNIYDDADILIEFEKPAELERYRVVIDECAILTEKQYRSIVKKIKTRILKHFEKLEK